MDNGESQIISVLPPGSHFKKKMTITKRGERLWLKFPFDRKLLEEIKTSFVGPKWHGFEDPPIKCWSVKDCYHNWFQLNFLQGQNPYASYLTKLEKIRDTDRPLYEHQFDMKAQLVIRKKCIISGEMGVGKTLALIEAIEYVNKIRILYAAPRSAIHAVDLEFEKWNCQVTPHFITYGSLKKLVENWEKGRSIYEIVVFDECHEIKTPTAQRSLAAMYIADAVRREHGDNGYIWLLSGSPAPRSPADWWHQCEVACPGFLKEGSIHKFKERLGITAAAENQITGGVYQQLVTWRDDENKCDQCGELKEHFVHDSINLDGHAFKPSVNEVALLGKRMSGLVMIKMKKDCLDLPEKRYQILRCKPSQDIINAAKMIAATAPSTIRCLEKLRELSDGFQYNVTKTGQTTCKSCFGNRETLQWIGPQDEVPQDYDYENNPDWEQKLLPCPACGGTGLTDQTERETVYVKTPKEDVLKDLIEQHDEIGRLVVYAGFTGSIDRIIQIIESIKGWEYIRVDGRGWTSSIGGNPKGLLKAFQEYKDKYHRIIFVGQPGAAGQGLSLTASPSIVYYSNDFNAKSRIQSEDRIHRPGMDTNRGATIYDIFHLPTDEYVYDNLKKKRELQDLSQQEIMNLLC